MKQLYSYVVIGASQALPESVVEFLGLLSPWRRGEVSRPLALASPAGSWWVRSGIRFPIRVTLG